MKRDFLKAMGLTDEQIDKIMSEHGTTVNTIKNERDNLVSERDNLKDEIKNRDGQITALEKTAGSAEGVQKELQRVKDENAKWESKYAGTLLDAKIQLAVAKDANDANDILFFIKKDGLKLAEDGSVEGLEDQLKTLKESKPYLFNASSQSSNTDPTGGQGDSGQAPPATPPPGFTPGSQQRGNNPKDPDPAALAKADIERRFGKQKEE